MKSKGTMAQPARQVVEQFGEVAVPGDRFRDFQQGLVRQRVRADVLDGEAHGVCCSIPAIRRSARRPHHRLTEHHGNA